MSLKHCVKRRVHLERAQPHARQGLGLLEKKKDYVKRAKDYHRKADAIAKLEEKARLKNTDEFYFKMVRTKVDKTDGLMKQVSTDHLSKKDKELAESTDARYVGMRRQIENRRAQRMKRDLHLLDVEKPNAHTIFVDDEAPGAVDVCAYLDTRPEFVHLQSNRPTKRQLREQKLFAAGKEARGDTIKAYTNLRNTLERSERLGKVLDVLDARHQAQSKDKKVKVKNSAGRTQYKFFPKRKR